MEDTFDIPKALVDTLRAAEHVTVLTGAGVSAESGVPTFREAQTGLWARYDPQQLATPQAFRRDPALVWDWYAWRRNLVADAAPNAGHYALVQMARRVPRVTIVTQNVDSLHQEAGSKEVIELHGNLRRIKCFDCGRQAPVVERSGDQPPRCPVCGGFLRPDVVWFGESLPVEALKAAMRTSEECDLFFTIGTSALVQPAATLPLMALEQGIPVVEINPQETQLSHELTYVLQGPSGVILPQLLALAWPD